jgi:MscS family membrane protein
MIDNKERISKWNRVLLFACVFVIFFIEQGSFHHLHAQTADTSNQTEPKKEKPPSNNILPSPEHKISPVQPEAIEKAAKKLETALGNGILRGLGGRIRTNAIAGITWLSLIILALTILLTAALERVIRWLINARIRKLSSSDKPHSWTVLFLEALSKPLSLFIWVYGAYAAMSIVLVQLQKAAGTTLLKAVAGKGADLGGSIAIIWLAYRLVVLSDVRIKTWASTRKNRIDDLLVTIVGRTLRVFIILIGGMVVVQNVTGIQLGPLIASLGIGGLAVALAAKESVANFLGTLTIILDKPFQIGDQVVIDKYEGTVDSVGFRSTRIRTPDGGLLTLPNSKVIDSPLQNVGRRPNIRWATNLGISYATPPDKVRRAIEILEEILDNHEGMKEDLPPRIYFNAFKDWSLNIKVVAWYHPPVWWEYQAWLQKTCMEILERFQQEGIRFALPNEVPPIPDRDQTDAELQMLKGESQGMDK